LSKKSPRPNGVSRAPLAGSARVAGRPPDKARFAVCRFPREGRESGRVAQIAPKAFWRSRPKPSPPHAVAGPRIQPVALPSSFAPFIAHRGVRFAWCEVSYNGAMTLCEKTLARQMSDGSKLLLSATKCGEKFWSDTGPTNVKPTSPADRAQQSLELQDRLPCSGTGGRSAYGWPLQSSSRRQAWVAHVPAVLRMRLAARDCPPDS